MSTRRLAAILEAIRRELPGVRRVSSYCLPRNVSRKSVAELRQLAELGLSLVYVGAESGDDDVLARVDKGETFASTKEALEKLGEAGIKRSVMILNGLGGASLSEAHAAQFRRSDQRRPAGVPGHARRQLPRAARRGFATNFPISRRSTCPACCARWKFSSRGWS